MSGVEYTRPPEDVIEAVREGVRAARKKANELRPDVQPQVAEIATKLCLMPRFAKIKSSLVFDIVETAFDLHENGIDALT